MRTVGVVPGAAADSLAVVGKFGICVAMCAIGLNANPVRLVRGGARPIVLGLSCWAAVAAAFLLVQRAAV